MTLFFGYIVGISSSVTLFDEINHQELGQTHPGDGGSSDGGGGIIECQNEHCDLSFEGEMDTFKQSLKNDSNKTKRRD